MNRRFAIPKETRLKAEDALRDWGVDFSWTEEGAILVPGDVNIGNYQLTEIPDLSFVIVNGYFNCTDNLLTTLKGMPQSVGGSFYCQNNRLTSLEGAPAVVGGLFWCQENRLSSLDHAPSVFRELKSDFGAFKTWAAVPEDLRLSAETTRRVEEQITSGKIVLKQPLATRKPFQFKKSNSR